jgi:hypothetical protein
MDVVYFHVENMQSFREILQIQAKRRFFEREKDYIIDSELWKFRKK